MQDVKGLACQGTRKLCAQREIALPVEALVRMAAN